MPKEFLKTDIKLDGFKELARFLDQLPKRVLTKALRQAVAAGATPIAKAARRLAPRLTGTLRKAIKKKVKTYRNGNAIAIVGADRDASAPANGASRAKSTGLFIPRNYIHLVELGVAPHAQPKNPFFKTDGHPGFRGRFFLKKAMEQNQSTTKQIMEEKMPEVLINEAQKLREK